MKTGGKTLKEKLQNMTAQAYGAPFWAWNGDLDMEALICDDDKVFHIGDIPGIRFPVMRGPFYDAVPDTDHGANILISCRR